MWYMFVDETTFYDLFDKTLEFRYIWFMTLIVLLTMNSLQRAHKPIWNKMTAFSGVLAPNRDVQLCSFCCTTCLSLFVLGAVFCLGSFLDTAKYDLRVRDYVPSTCTSDSYNETKFRIRSSRHCVVNMTVSYQIPDTNISCNNAQPYTGMDRPRDLTFRLTLDPPNMKRFMRCNKTIYDEGNSFDCFVGLETCEPYVVAGNSLRPVCTNKLLSGTGDKKKHCDRYYNVVWIFLFVGAIFIILDCCIQLYYFKVCVPWHMGWIFGILCFSNHVVLIWFTFFTGRCMVLNVCFQFLWWPMLLFLKVFFNSKCPGFDMKWKHMNYAKVYLGVWAFLTFTQASDAFSMECGNQHSSMLGIGVIVEYLSIICVAMVWSLPLCVTHTLRKCTDLCWQRNLPRYFGYKRELVVGAFGNVRSDPAVVDLMLCMSTSLEAEEEHIFAAYSCCFCERFACWREHYERVIQGDLVRQSFLGSITHHTPDFVDWISDLESDHTALNLFGNADLSMEPVGIWEPVGI